MVEITPVISPDLRVAWEATATAAVGPPYEPKKEAVPMGSAQWLGLLSCREEKQQVELPTRLQGEGLDCRALLS